MRQQIITQDTGGRRGRRYAFLVVSHDDGTEPIVLVRRQDLRTSKWSAGNVTPEQRSWALAEAGR